MMSGLVCNRIAVDNNTSRKLLKYRQMVKGFTNSSSKTHKIFIAYTKEE